MTNERDPSGVYGAARSGVVYFAQCRDAVKIGYTTGSPDARVAALQTGCPWPIWLLGSVASPPAGEVLLHNALADHRLRGEWFDASAVAAVLGGLGVDRPLASYFVAWLEDADRNPEPLTEHATVKPSGVYGLVECGAWVFARCDMSAARCAPRQFKGLDHDRWPSRHVAPDTAGHLLLLEDLPDQWVKLADLLGEEK